MFVFQMLLLNLEELGLCAEELLGLASDSGIAARKFRGNRGSEGLGAGEHLRRFYFRFLFVISEESAEHPFSHGNLRFSRACPMFIDSTEISNKQAFWRGSAAVFVRPFPQKGSGHCLDRPGWS
jgi:hypothetical protein